MEPSSTYAAVWSRDRRSQNRDSDQCVNQNKQGTHGPRVDGTTRCAVCLKVYFRTTPKVHMTEAERAAVESVPDQPRKRAKPLDRALRLAKQYASLTPEQGYADMNAAIVLAKALLRLHNQTNKGDRDAVER